MAKTASPKTGRKTMVKGPKVKTGKGGAEGIREPISTPMPSKTSTPKASTPKKAAPKAAKRMPKAAPKKTTARAGAH